MSTYDKLRDYLDPNGVKLVAVSKTKPIAELNKLYDKGQRIFGENRVPELVDKWETMPKDIEWHMIGTLQKNKVKYIAPFISLIHSVDSLRLAKIIDKEALKSKRIIDVLLQVKIASEESKMGYVFNTLERDIAKIKSLPNINIRGVMGMGTFTDDTQVTTYEFSKLRKFYRILKEDHFDSPSSSFTEISMGMSGDYALAVENGSTMVRIGSLLFGSR